MLNQKVCVIGGGNTGIGDCNLDIKNIVAIFMVPPDTEILPADLEDLGAYLEGKVIEDDRTKRFYPVHNFVEVTDNSEDVNIASLGYGGKAFVREGDYDWTFRFIKGGMCLLKSLMKFNGANKDVFFVDQAGVLFGSENNGNLRSIPLELLLVPKFTLNDGSGPANYGIRVSFNPKHINENLGFVDTTNAGIVISTFKGVQNMSLVVVDHVTDPVANIRAVAGCDRRNLYGDFSTLLADETLWKAYLADGTVLTVTSVTANATLETFTVTVTDGDTDDFTEFYLETVGPTALAVAGVDGYESIRVLVN